MGSIIGVDIGGTFTDCVVVSDDGKVTIGKALSTGPDFDEGFINAVAATAERLGLSLEQLVSSADGIYHGCTVGTNAMVEGRTATVALLTTRGHRDVLSSMQAGRRLRTQTPDYIAHVSMQTKPEPLVPRSLIFEVDERVGVDGAAIVELNEERAVEGIRELVARGAEAFSISLLWSVANDAHERRLAELVEREAPGRFVSRASAVVNRIGEYERTVATVVNSLIGPAMDEYLAQVQDRLRRLGYRKTLQIMTCSGGVIAAQEARRLPMLTIGSGPVGGLIGSGALGRVSAGGGAQGNGRSAMLDVITADMGGTTLDVGVIRDAQPLSRATSWHDQYEYFVPTLDVRSIGSGGGSIIRYDADLGTLRVGPRSAGSRPGPVCYGRGGTEATVTDANVVLGYINPENFLGGEMSLDVDGARAALARAGEPLGYSAEQTAMAAIRIVENQMADAIRLASVQQGYDPRHMSLFAYGGAGPLHGVALARELGIGRVVVPLSDLAAGWSAFGIASSDVLVVEEDALSLVSPFEAATLAAGFDQLEAKVLERMKVQDIAPADVTLVRYADMRYQRQVNEVEVELPGGAVDVDALTAAFEREYGRLFGEGTGFAAAGFAITGLRVRGSARSGEFSLAEAAVTESVADARRGERLILFPEGGGEREAVPIFDGPALAPGVDVVGPAIVEFPDTSVIVHGGAVAGVDPFGSVVVQL